RAGRPVPLRVPARRGRSRRRPEEVGRLDHGPHVHCRRQAVTSAALLVLVVAAAEPPSDTDLKKRAEALVAQLGDPDYRDRERAAKELLAIGYAAKDAVVAGQRSPDQEISDRCQKLYPSIWRSDLDKRVQRFLDNPDGRIRDDLPGAAHWLKVAGDG